MNPLAALRNRFLDHFLDRCVLRPSRHAIHAGDLTRYELPLRLPDSNQATTLEAFLATNRPLNAIPSGSPPGYVRGLPDGLNVPPPRTLVIKFPGTAGRAERSSPFPANLITAHWDEGAGGSRDSERGGGTGGPEALCRAGASIDDGDHYEVWTWNPPGYGRSSGRASLANLVPTAEAFISQVTRARSGSQTQLWLCGNSLGCLPALSLAARLPDWLPPNVAPSNCLLWLRNPPDLANTILRVADRYAARAWMQRVVAHLPEQLSALDNAAKCNLPAVFLMSEHDELVPPPLQRSIHEAYAGDHRVVTLADLDHGGVIDHQHRDEVQSAANWLWKKAPHSYSLPIL